MWSSSSIPTEAAWAVLKRDDMGSLSPELQDQMKSFYESIPEEQQQKIQAIAQAVDQMEPEKTQKIKEMLLRTLSHNAERLPDILNDANPEDMFPMEQSEPGTFKVSSLKNDVTKAFFVPLLIYGTAALFAADGANQAAGAKASIVGNGLLHVGAKLGTNEPPKTSAFDYSGGGFAEEAVFQDPFLGVELGRVENPSWWQTGAAIGLGALQGFSPIKGAKAKAKVSTKATDKVSRLKGKQPFGPVTQRTQEKIRQAGDKAALARVNAAKSRTLTGRAATGAKKGAYRLAQATAGDPRAGKFLQSLFASQMHTGDSPNIQGTATANPSAGAGSGTGVGGIGNRAAMGHADKQIWQGQEWSGQHGQTKKGDNMKIGEQILKEVDLRIHKAHCATHKADDCPKCKGKKGCQCGDNTKKGSKKPAHGMIIVLGAQGTGPGPSKDGKRTKK